MNRAKIYKSILIALTAIFLLTGCQSDGNSGNSTDGKSPKEKIEAMENSGELPKLDRSSDIKGPDKNQNGIRDDIEEYIIKNYPDEKQRKAVFQDARAMQESLLVDLSDKIAVKQVGTKMSRSVHCLFLTFKSNDGPSQNPHIISKQIESMTANTKSRLKAYLAFNKALDGTAWASPEGDSCE